MSPLILVADDDAAIRTVVRQALQLAGYRVTVTGTAEGLQAMAAELQPAVVVTDVILPDGNGLDVIPALLSKQPGLRIIVMSAQNTLSTAVKATENGAFDYLPKPFDLDELVDAVASALSGGIDAEPTGLGDDLLLIGRSQAMQDVYRTIARVVATDLTVMILGESGTGKELVARAIHDLGPRKGKPFVAINMAAIPHELIESELFGHERGAFTGAATRASGRFEQAKGGTLFLDEIGDMPLAAQTRLLRVLQSGEFHAVGGTRLLSADVRIISATNQDLAGLVSKGQFREDLFYRLNVVPVALPPLRAREGDIALLARAFLSQAAAEGLPRKVLEDDAVSALCQHNWPGNVRELENMMRRLAALERGDTISAAAVYAGLSRHLAQRIDAPAETSLAEAAGQQIALYFQRYLPGLPPDGVHERLMAEVERPLLLTSLAACQGNQLKAARLLGMNRNTLRKRLSELDIHPARGN